MSKTKKQSRLDRVENALAHAISVLEAQGNAVNYLLTEVNNLKVANLDVVDEEEVKPEQEDELIR